MQEKEVCGNCHYAEVKKNKASADWFFCFRYPPIQMSIETNAVSPEVYIDRTACGEFKHKDVVKVRTPNIR